MIVAAFACAGFALGVAVFVLLLLTLPGFERVFNGKPTAPISIMLFGCSFAWVAAHIAKRLVSKERSPP
jgi:hypothetical protein